MKFADSWWWPDSENHMNAWIADPKNRVIMSGRPAYQGKKQQALLRLCKHFRTAIDVGAHIGTWTYNLAPLFKTVRCFEPIRAHRECFARNIEAENVVMYPIALGSARGKVSMFTNDTSSGDSWVRFDGECDTQMETLDSFEFAEIDLMKLDAEGFEESILRGARATILKCQPVICVEQKREMARKFGLEPQGAVRFLESLGYQVAKEIGGDYLMTPLAMPAAA